MRQLQVAALTCAMLLAPARLPAAEVHGEVTLRHTGLFQGGAVATMGDISVSVEPGEGQPWPASATSAARSHRLVMKDKQLRPAYLTVRRGDSLEFINQDNVYHDLFALSPVQPINVYLGKVSQGGDARGEVTLGTTGSWHLFCSIHSRMYARIDAVDSRLIKMVAPGDAFRFGNLKSGQWRMRVAALGTETRFINAVALTAAPKLTIDLYTKGGASAATGHNGLPVQGHVEQLFPID